MKRLLILMAKQPAPGQTKTRLIPALNAHAAAELYHCFLLDKIRQMRQVEAVQPAIAYYPATARTYFGMIAPDFTLYLQQGNDLSERLKHVIQVAFDQGYDQVAAIDSDTVTLPSEYLMMALDVLHQPEVDVSIGACEDGGYYAIGMKAPHLSLFDVQMSTARVLEDTLTKAKAARLSVHRLPAWYDVDTPADLQRLRAEIDPVQAPATALFLKGLSW